MPAVVVPGRGFDGQVGQAELLVHADLRPRARVSRVGPRVVQPGVVAELAGRGNRLEDPEALARAHVEPAHVPLDVALAGRHSTRSMCGSDDDDVPGDDGRGVQTDLTRERIDALIHLLLEIDHAVLAEARDRAPGRRVKRDQAIAGGDVEDAVLFAVGPVGEAAARELPWRRRTAWSFVEAVDPALLSGGCVERHNGPPRAGRGV